MYPKPDANFDFFPEKPVEGLETVTFENKSTGENQTKWNWFFIDNEGYKPSGKNTSYFFPDAGNYPVALRVENMWRCADTLVKVITVDYDFSMYVPNTFTPNNDGINDVFLPVLRSAKSYNLTVFNRWGALLFETKDVLTGWDGSYRGEVCKNDIYIWKITLSAMNGTTKTATGNITLSK